MIIIGIILIVVGIVLFFIKQNQSHKGFSIKSANSTNVKELESTAHSITQEIGGGSWRDYVKVWGKISASQPLISELKNEPCVYYTMTVKREYEETIQKQDSEGKWVQETKRSSDVVSSNQRKIPFILEDQTGTISVNPEGAEIETVKVLDQFVSGEARGQMISFGGFSLALGSSNNNSQRRTLGYHYTEHILPIEHNILVVGEVSDETGNLMLTKPLEAGKRFIISLKTEQSLNAAIAETEKTLLWSMIACLGLGVIFVILDVVF
jgi:hypothetical protein